LLIFLQLLIGGGTPKTKISEYWNGDIPWLSVVDFNTGNKFVFDTEKKITQVGLENSSTKFSINMPL
jgi:type I restriction enzyme S subunit